MVQYTQIQQVNAEALYNAMRNSRGAWECGGKEQEEEEHQQQEVISRSSRFSFYKVDIIKVADTNNVS